MITQKPDALAKALPETVQVADIQNVRALAKDLLESGLFPGVRNVQGAVTVIQAGLELGIPPVAALNTMAIISGRLTLEAKALLAIAQKRAGVTWSVVREDDKGCEIVFSRPGWPDTSSTFTEDEAKAAGLLGKANWKTWPKDMYFARAASRGIRRIAPDAVLGLYSKEEMTDAVPLNDTATPRVPPAVVHKPKDVEDEFTAGNPLPADTEPEASEPDPFAEAHHDTPEKVAAKVAEVVPGPTLAQLEKFAKSKADLNSLSVSETVMWDGIQRFAMKNFNHGVVELSELMAVEVDSVLGYLDRWRKARHAEIEGAKGKKS